MLFRGYWLAKHGNRPEEWEDAYAADVTAGRFAMADGAAESVFAGSWAKLLVDGFVKAADCPSNDWQSWLSPLQAIWRERYRGRELPWYTELKLQDGAFATFLGVVMEEPREDSRPWQAVAVGDSCLFHVRAHQLLEAFPLIQSDQFGNSPDLLGSRASPEEIARQACIRHGVGMPEDELWLMTDALARWCLLTIEAGESPWKEMGWLLEPEGREEDFAAWIQRMRTLGRLRNDDVSVVAIRL
jgi:hypothetical protein